MILPIAPSNFYSPSLNQLKNSLELQDVLTKGQVALVTATPTNIETAWAEVGAGGDGVVGSLVVGLAPISTITGPVIGPEQSPGENGYKLQFATIPEVPVYIDGSGTATATVIGVALLRGRNVFADGIDDDVKYIVGMADLIVTDGGKIQVPEFEIIINYGEIVV